MTTGDQLRRGLEGHPLVTDTTGRGLLMGVVLSEPRAAAVARDALAAGLIINAPTPDRLRLAPPLVLTEDEAAHAVSILRAVLTEVST